MQRSFDSAPLRSARWRRAAGTRRASRRPGVFL